MRFSLPVTAMSAALLLAACQAGGQNDGPATGAPAARNVAERNAVAAFGRICAILDRDTVTQRAAQFGFLPARQDAIPADMRASLEANNGLMLVRPGSAPAMLLWSEPQACELWVSQVQITAMEQEFGQFLDRIASVPNSRSVVTRLPPEQAARMRASDGSQLRQGASIAPRDLVATPPRAMVLRVPGTPGVFDALMIHRVVPSSQGAPAATAAQAGPAKDPVR